MTFSAPTSAATAATLSVPGVYTLRLTANDSQASTTDDVMVTLSAAPLPTLTIADVAVVEGQGDGVNAVLTVSLSAPSAEAVAFAYATGEGTASAECDYRRRYRAMTFPPGSTTRFVAVPIVGDLAAEAAETFPVHVGDVTGAVLGDGEAQVTILSYELWQSAFGGRSSLVGQQVDIDGIRRTIIGIMPRPKSVVA